VSALHLGIVRTSNMERRPKRRHGANRRVGSRFHRMKRRKLWAEATTLWAITIATSGYIGWTIWSALATSNHTHVPVALLLADLFILLMAMLISFEWWKSRHQ
jgi:uncharacterized membrane protein